jgi:hypothetical protein
LGFPLWTLYRLEARFHCLMFLVPEVPSSSFVFILLEACLAFTLFLLLLRLIGRTAFLVEHLPLWELKSWTPSLRGNHNGVHRQAEQGVRYV